MTSDTVSLLAAALFLLIAVVGGGFTVKELSMPAVPTWGRVVAGVVGVLFAISVVFGLAGSDDADETSSDADADSAVSGGTVEFGDPAVEGEVTIWDDDEPDTTPEFITVQEVKATGDQPEPKVGSRVTVTFTIQNDAEEPFQFDSTFVGARQPGGGNADFGDGNYSRILQPGDSLTVSGSIIVDEPGTWQLFPCYIFQMNGEDGFCPDSWKAFPVHVVP